MRYHEIFEKLLDVRTPSIHTLAKKYGVSVSEIEKQVERGIKIESEHTTHKDVAKEIALDHLGEKLDYYDLLAKVEVDEQELDEGRDAPLFHFTDVDVLSRLILPENKLKAANPSITRGNGDDGAKASVSFTRNLKTVFFSNQSSVLIMNQTKLAHRYKMTPQFGDSPKFASWVKPENEQEERIHSDVAPLNVYVKAIGIALKLPLDDNDRRSMAATGYRAKLLTPILEYSEKYGIPIVLQSSIKMNGTWTHDVTQEIKDYLAKISDQTLKIIKYN